MSIPTPFPYKAKTKVLLLPLEVFIMIRLIHNHRAICLRNLLLFSFANSPSAACCAFLIIALHFKSLPSGKEKVKFLRSRPPIEILRQHERCFWMQTKQRLAEEGIDWQDELTEYQPVDDYCDVSLGTDDAFVMALTASSFIAS